MRILVTGASGFIGSHVLQALLAAGHQVVAGVRRSDSIPVRDGCSVLSMDFSNFSMDGEVSEWLPQLQGLDAVVNCVGIIAEDRRNRFDALHSRGPIALFRACSQAGVKKAIQISALGADDTAFSRYHLSKKTADDFLISTDLDWAILQPSMVYGAGGKSLTLFAALAALPVTPLVDGGGQQLQPVHVDDLVAAILRLLEPGAPGRMKLDIVGPEAVTMAGMLAMLRGWLGREPASVCSVPFRFALTMAEIAGHFVASPVNGEALRMLQQGNTGDSSALTALLGRPPKSLATALRQWPARQAERWHAGLFFLVPALRYALALMWIWSGLTSALLYPPAESYAMLAAVGVTGIAAPWALYGASLVDGLLGLAFLLRYRVRLAGVIQLGLMAVYSLAIGICLPEFLLHPFAPLVKNLPLIVATLIVIATEES